MQPFERTAVLYMLKHLASGVLGAVVFTVALLALDVANLASLMGASDQGMVAGAMLFTAMALTFGGAAICIGIFALADGALADGQGAVNPPDRD